MSETSGWVIPAESERDRLAAELERAHGVMRDVIYGLREQPELSREQIAQAIEGSLAAFDASQPPATPLIERDECQRCSSDRWTWRDYRGCSECFEPEPEP